MTYTRPIITETGCFLDNHRGHYITRDIIEFAVGYGFIIGPFEKFVVDSYDRDNGDEDYPFEGLIELADEAVAWLNIGDNEGIDRPIRGQNSPPIIPDGYAWGMNDGDFGLYPSVLFNIGYEDSKGHKPIAQEVDIAQARSVLQAEGVRAEVIEHLLDQHPEDMALQAGGFIVEAIDPQF